MSASLRDKLPPVAGELTFVDNTVDATTGMVQLKATFENKDRRLWPGQYVDVVLTLMDRPNSVVVPSSAVQEGQETSYVFVVDKDDFVSVAKWGDDTIPRITLVACSKANKKPTSTAYRLIMRAEANVPP